ncbi:hypothetical protein D5085_07575 [Ectothiorhodospiraceae bacterium BW-2]|nr:hypothetical protein D5085_07575 [Ectothiorhodospiraceae bacterium BW-2]
MNIEQMMPLVQQLQHHEKLELIHRLIDWVDEESKRLPKEEPNGTKVAQLMAKIAERGTAFREIDDPAAWQREIRQDRPLPGRE